MYLCECKEVHKEYMRVQSSVDMETLRIDIKKLGSIENAQITLSPVMLFLGESGLGKSYVAMLCHYIYEFLLDSQRLNRFFEERDYDFNQMQHTWKDAGVAIEIDQQELEEWLSEDDAIRYLRDMLNHEEFSAILRIFLPPQKNGTFRIDYTTSLKGLVNKEDLYYKLTLDDLSYNISATGQVGEESPFAFLLRHALIQKIFGHYNALRQAYILPPARAVALTEEVYPLTGLYRRYQQWFRGLSYYPELDERYEQLGATIANVIGGRIERKDGEFFYITSDDVEMPVSASAASVRELGSLAYLIGKRDMGTTALLFEEPEAHLHPLKQRKMADVIARLKELGAHMQITTHSDYFLRRMNELIMLGKLRETFENKHHEDAQTAFYQACEARGIDPSCTFATQGFSAYYFCREGDGITRIVSETDFSSGISFKTFFDVLEEDVANGERISDWLMEQA